MSRNSVLAERVTDYFVRKRVPFEAKAMMGGLCFMVDGKMCVGVTKDRLMVRLDPAVEAEALTRPGCVPMEMGGRTMRGFVRVHAEGLDTEKDLRYWLELALEFNPRAVASRKSRGPSSGVMGRAGKRRAM